jgi:hypothetical protein
MDFQTQGELKSIIDGYHSMDSYTKLTERWDHQQQRHDFVEDLAIVIGDVHQPFSHRHDHIIGELLGSVICACITSVANFSLECYSTKDDELLMRSQVPRLFDGASFIKTVAWVMSKTKYPFLIHELDLLHRGKRNPNVSCLPHGSPIVMLIEDWCGEPRKDMDLLMAEEYSRRQIEQERQQGISSTQVDISSPPHQTQQSTDQSTPPSRKSSTTQADQLTSDEAKVTQLIGEISFTQSPQSLQSSPMGLNVSQITVIPEHQPVLTTTDPNTIPPIA